MELQTSKSKREIEKSLYELVESTEKEARVPVARAVYRRIQLPPSKALGRWEFRIPGKGKARPIRTAPAPSSHFTPDVDRPPRLAVDGLGIPETDPDGGPSAGTRQRVGLGPRGGDESLELGRSGRRGPHLERVAAARLVLDDDRRAERLLEGRALSPKPRRILVLLGRFVLLPAPEEVGPRAGPLGDRLRPGLDPERGVRAP